MLKVVVLLDDLSKRVVRLDNSLLRTEDVTVVSKLIDVTDSMLDDARKVVILDGALDCAGSIKELQFFKNVANFNYVFLLAKKENIEIANELGSVYKCDLSILDYELVQAGVFGDASYVSEKDCFGNSKDYAETIVSDESMPSSVRDLARDYCIVMERESVLSERLKNQQDMLDTIANRNAVLTNENERWREGYNTLLSRIANHNGELAKYETILSSDIYVKMNLHSYPNRPAIVYLKVFTDFIGLNTFLETLVDVFRYQLKKSVKVLQLFDGSGDRRIRMLPAYYKKLHNYYTMEEVIENNYLCKSGEYTNLLDRLLNNKYGLGTLIIVDCKDHDDGVLTGSFLQYNLCRTVTQAKMLALPQNQTIVNSRNSGWLNWVPEKVDDLRDEERFIKLSSRDVIQQIVKVADKYANAF